MAFAEKLILKLECPFYSLVNGDDIPIQMNYIVRGSNADFLNLNLEIDDILLICSAEVIIFQ